MDAVWVNELYIDTSASGAAQPTWSKLCDGIEGMQFNENEQNQQNFFLCGEGFAHNEVTGAAPELVITGRRIVGNTAQDYIAGMQFKLGSERNSKAKVVAEGKQIICPCSVGAITSFGGNALDLNAFGCTLRLNGKPEVTAAT